MLEQKLNSEQKDETQLPSSPNNAKPDVVRSPISLSTEDAGAKEIYEQNQKFNTEILDKIYLLLNGLSYRKAKHILQLAMMNLANKTNLHIEPSSDKNKM